MTQGTECCSDIVKAKADIASIARDLDSYKVEAQRWREQHSAHNTDTTERIFSKLDNIEGKLTSWVNPVLALVISVLTAVLGLLGGALWVAIK